MRAFQEQGQTGREDMMRGLGLWAAVVGLTVTFGLTGAGYAAWYMQEGAPNDSTSRALNEMKAKARELPAASDPRDARIAALEKQVADLEAELTRLRSASGSLGDANRRISELERQLADRDRELASLRSSAGDSSKLASQLSATQGELDLAKGRISDLEKSLAAAGAGASAAELAAKSSSGEADKLAAQLAAANNDKEKLAADLDAAHRRIADLEGQLAALQGDLSAEMAKLKEAQRGLIRALRPQIEKGDITVDLNNERLLINLASSYLFGTGEDTLKPAGADALKHVGAVLKDFPEYKVAVDGHTDNVPIRGSLKKRFPTNQELSESRAANAARALAEGGLTAAKTAGYADTKPVESNKTAEGRAKNRRVEVRVTK